MFHLKNNSNKPKKVNFPFKENNIYVIYYNPPFAYIRQADRLLLLTFSNFVEEWNIEYNGVEGKVKAILLYAGLPLKKEKVPNSIMPNIEDLEKASDLEAYYYIAMQWIFSYLENTQPNILMKLADTMRDSRGIQIKVKELEGKKIVHFSGNPKGFLYDLIDIIQQSREINLEEVLQDNRPTILKIFSFLAPKSLEQVRSILYIILIGAIFVIVVLFIKTFAATLSNIHYLNTLSQTLNHGNITLPINTTNLSVINETYHITNPLI